MTSLPRNRVWEIFKAQQLIPSEATYRQGRQEVTILGQQLYRKLESNIGRWTLRQALKPLHRPYVRDDMIRVLGFGGSMTEYCMVAHRHETPQKDKLIWLGGLANTIVTLYDQFIDNGASPRLLSKYQLAATASPSSRL